MVHILREVLVLSFIRIGIDGPEMKAECLATDIVALTVFLDIGTMQ